MVFIPFLPGTTLVTTPLPLSSHTTHLATPTLPTLHYSLLQLLPCHNTTLSPPQHHFLPQQHSLAQHQQYPNLTYPNSIISLPLQYFQHTTHCQKCILPHNTTSSQNTSSTTAPPHVTGTPLQHYFPTSTRPTATAQFNAPFTHAPPPVLHHFNHHSQTLTLLLSAQ